MFTLHTPRVSRSVHFDQTFNCASLAECMDILNRTWHTDAWVIGPKGERYDLHETENADDPDYVDISFRLSALPCENCGYLLTQLEDGDDHCRMCGCEFQDEFVLRA